MKMKIEEDLFQGHIWKCISRSMMTNKTLILAQFKGSDTWFLYHMT